MTTATPTATDSNGKAPRFHPCKVDTHQRQHRSEAPSTPAVAIAPSTNNTRKRKRKKKTNLGIDDAVPGAFGRLEYPRQREIVVPLRRKGRRHAQLGPVPSSTTAATAPPRTPAAGTCSARAAVRAPPAPAPPSSGRRGRGRGGDGSSEGGPTGDELHGLLLVNGGRCHLCVTSHVSFRFVSCRFVLFYSGQRRGWERGQAGSVRAASAAISLKMTATPSVEGSNFSAG